MQPGADGVRRTLFPKELPGPLEPGANDLAGGLALANGAQSQVEQPVEVRAVERDERLTIAGTGAGRKPISPAQVGCRSHQRPTFRRGSECRSVFNFVNPPSLTPQDLPIAAGRVRDAPGHNVLCPYTAAVDAATPPPTRYARSGDLSIAYHVLGEGPPDLVMTPGSTSHLEYEYGWPALVQFYERLGSFARVIRFDKRGTGLSDRTAGIATLEERMDDIRAIMDAAGSERAVIGGLSEGGEMSILFAATYPKRTQALILSEAVDTQSAGVLPKS